MSLFVGKGKVDSHASVVGTLMSIFFCVRAHSNGSVWVFE